MPSVIRFLVLALFFLPRPTNGQDSTTAPLKEPFICNRHATTNDLPAMVEGTASAADGRDYGFDGTMTRPVLEHYLSRSITMLDLLTGHGDVDDNIRMLKNTGVKFVSQEETIKSIWSTD